MPSDAWRMKCTLRDNVLAGAHYSGGFKALAHSMTPVRRHRFSQYVASTLLCSLLFPQAAFAQRVEAPAPMLQDDPFALAVTPVKPSNDARLDIEDLRRSARELVAEDDQPSGPTGTVFAAAAAPELQRFKNRFDDGKRPWCLTAFQGAGVLALIAMPLAALLDKKDHGCKW